MISKTKQIYNHFISRVSSVLSQNKTWMIIAVTLYVADPYLENPQDLKSLGEWACLTG